MVSAHDADAGDDDDDDDADDDDDEDDDEDDKDDEDEGVLVRNTVTGLGCQTLSPKPFGSTPQLGTLRKT